LYVWGTNVPQLPILINGHRVEKLLTSNLYCLLRQLLDDDEAQNLWIDAICLNQGDPIEKEQQIPRMGDIYASAQRTFIWLGPSENESDYDFKRYSPDAPEWLAHKRLFKRDWWMRVWTLQEAVLSRAPIVKCGRKEVELKRFVDFEYLYYDQRTLVQAKDHDKFWGLRYYLQVPYQSMFWRDIETQLGGPMSLWFHSSDNFAVVSIGIKSLGFSVCSGREAGTSLKWTTTANQTWKFSPVRAYYYSQKLDCVASLSLRTLRARSQVYHHGVRTGP
jgi:hypothetical protein